MWSNLVNVFYQSSILSTSYYNFIHFGWIASLNASIFIVWFQFFQVLVKLCYNIGKQLASVEIITYLEYNFHKTWNKNLKFNDLFKFKVTTRPYSHLGNDFILPRVVFPLVNWLVFWCYTTNVISLRYCGVIINGNFIEILTGNWLNKTWCNWRFQAQGGHSRSGKQDRRPQASEPRNLFLGD